MIVLEFLGKVFVEWMFEGVIIGFFRLLKKGYNYLISFKLRS